MKELLIMNVIILLLSCNVLGQTLGEKNTAKAVLIKKKEIQILGKQNTAKAILSKKKGIQILGKQNTNFLINVK